MRSKTMLILLPSIINAESFDAIYVQFCECSVEISITSAE